MVEMREGRAQESQLREKKEQGERVETLPFAACHRRRPQPSAGLHHVLGNALGEHG